MDSTLIIYGGKNCHLCEVARAAADNILPRYGLSYEYVNIRTDAALSQRYDEMIPVLALPAEQGPDGASCEAQILLFGNIDEGNLESALVGSGFHPLGGGSS